MRMRTGLVAVIAMAASLTVPAGPARAAASEIGRLVAPKPVAVAVDPSISAMYVAGQDGELTIYDTRTYAKRTVELTCCLAAVVADPATHQVYVAGNGVLVVDGVAGVAETVISLAPGTPDALALDAAGGRLFAADPPGDRVAVIDTATRSVAASLPVRDHPAGLAFGAGVLYVASAGEDAVDAIDPSTGAVLATAPVPSPSGIAIGDGEIFVAGGDGRVHVLDATSLAPAGTFVVGATPRGLAYNPVSRRLWVANWGSGTVSFVDTATGTVLGTMPSGTRPLGVAFDPGLGRTYVAVHGAGHVQLLHEAAASISIGWPGQGATIGPSKRTITGTAPPGTPVTIFEGTTAVGSAVADLSGAFAVPTLLGEGAHTIVAAVPYEPYSPARSFTVDLTPPSITLMERTPPGPSGWNRTAVHLVWRCTDALSGVKNAQIEKVLGFDGRDQSASATCEDLAGNKTTHTVTDIDIDQRGPTISMVRSPAAIAGWNRTSPVTVSFTCTDTLSGMPAPATHAESVAGATAGREVSFQCADVAGNVAVRSEVVRIDLAAPSGSVDAGQIPAATRVPVELDYIVRPGVNGGATDDASGVSSAEVRFVDEGGFERITPAACTAGCGTGRIRWRVRPPPLMDAGWYEVSVRATDLAGNVGAWSAATRMIIATAEEWPRIPLPPLPV